MPRHPGTVFVDTNVILECHRVGSWRALTGGYRVETVDECVDETEPVNDNETPRVDIY